MPKYDVTLEISVRITETVEADTGGMAVQQAKATIRKQLEGSKTHKFGRIEFLDWEVEPMEG